MSPPFEVARKLADILDKDPVMAAQLKENIAVQRLLELLDLPREQVEAFYQIPGNDQ